jgi:Zn-dependent protease
MPYILDLQNVTLDYLVAFCLGILFSVTINAEAQAFVAQILGDVRSSDKTRFHFNAFRHLDILGTIAFFIAGFGWPRNVDVDTSKFKHPRLYSVIVQCSGPAANFILASIVSSFCLIVEQFSIDSRMFKIVLGVNLMMAVSNLLPFPPLALGKIPATIIPERYKRFKKTFFQVSPYLLATLLFLERSSQIGIVNYFLVPIFSPVFGFFTKSYTFG